MDMYRERERERERETERERGRERDLSLLFCGFLFGVQGVSSTLFGREDLSDKCLACGAQRA
jgi:hypothetical protein